MKHSWTDNPMVSGVSPCEPDIVNENLMYLKESTDENKTTLDNVPKTYATKSEAKYTSGDGIDITDNTVTNTLYNSFPVQNMYTTGEVSTDTNGYNQLLQMKRSTYDKDKFIIVGNPNISDDGIIGGITTNDNYVRTITLDKLKGKSWTIKGKLLITDKENNSISAVFTTHGWNAWFSIQIRTETKVIYFYNRTGTSSDTNNEKAWAGKTFDTLPDIINFEYSFDLMKGQYTARLDWGEGMQEIGTYIPDTTNKQLYYLNAETPASNYICIGRGSGNENLKQSVDLKRFSIIVEGKEIFNGNKQDTDTVVINAEEVDIPYFETKTGSKIVDVAYRDTVKALYDQEGVAPYFTLDETNKDFTLPMGEIYGMLNRKGEGESTGGGTGVELLTVLCMPLGVDESRNVYRYLNGQLIMQDQFKNAVNKLKKAKTRVPNLFTTEVNWQAEKSSSKFGQCGKFVIDDEAGTVRLPRVINISGLINLMNSGVIKTQSLPNITGGDFFYESGASVFEGAIYNAGTGFGSKGGSDEDNPIGKFDASKSDSTYQNNAPVQQESIQYPYVICLNSDVEETDKPINNYQVNNVYSYGVSQYYKGVMNNLSWLRSLGQWNRGTTYNGVYEWAVGKLNEKVYDPSKFTVVGSPTITSDGVASWFSTRDYLNIPINLTNSSLFSIDIEVDTRVGTGSGWVYSNPDIATNLCIWTDSNAKNFSFHFGQVNLKSVNVDYNSKYSLHFSRESETSFKIKIIDVISKEIKYDNTITAQIKNTFNVNKLNIGYPSSASLIAIDLKSLSITVDGEEVFSGSKIVQADGFKKSTDSDITDYDWVVNTENQTFRLPLKNGQEGVFASSVKGNGMALGITNGTVNMGINPINLAGTGSLSGFTSLYGTSVGTVNVNTSSYSNGAIGITTDSSKSGMVVDLTVPDGYNLYYYVGDTLQNTDLINLARISEEIVDIKSTPHIEEVYVNGTSGYRIWSPDSTGYRYCEQWGYLSSSDWLDDPTITLLRAYKDTNYTIILSKSDRNYGPNGQSWVGMSTTKNTGSFAPHNNYIKAFDWITRGYLAD